MSTTVPLDRTYRDPGRRSSVVNLFRKEFDGSEPGGIGYSGLLPPLPKELGRRVSGQGSAISDEMRLIGEARPSWAAIAAESGFTA